MHTVTDEPRQYRRPRQNASPDAPEGAKVVTNKVKAYRLTAKHAANHKIAGHSAGEYVRNMARTNGIVSFWPLPGRRYIVVYHYMNEEYPRRFASEFSFGNTILNVAQ
jgi:hypothetical protein